MISMREFMDISKALAEENRIRILWMLKDTELCVCQIVEVLNLAPSTVSKHLAILNQARLTDFSKRGRWVYYRLCCDNSRPETVSACHWVYTSLVDDPQILADQVKLKELLTLNPEDLCRIQAER
jgi:ArsR family transcriptional regulator, arsenate/arsenite/antimonite-responsive transcriptional repressor